MKLNQLLKAVEAYDFTGNADLEIPGLAYDSRDVKPGYLFVAVRGHALDGHHYLRDALKRGAAALVAEDFKGFEGKAALVRVPDSRKALSKLAGEFYRHPFEKMKLVAITGTNGKTTISYLLESILSTAGRIPGVIGTINYRVSGQIRPASVTTPESLDLMRILRDMADSGATDVVMEVSSHALDQGRTGDCPFEVAVFTNITRDHLDYHGTMEAYFEVKSRLFRGLVAGSTAVLNLDDPKGKDLAAVTPARVLTYGLDKACRVRADVVSSDRRGMEIRLMTPAGERRIRSSMLGEVNVYNILGAVGAALSLGVDLETAARGIETLETVPGRLERVKNTRGLSVVVDYAHTPDALLKALQTLRPLTEGRLIIVFGCGGDRDRGKRYEMGLVSGKNSDLVVITSDNPRSEEPLAISSEIERGVRESGLVPLIEGTEKQDHLRGYLIESERREAIRKAFKMAVDEDLILIAGKGHEDYQIVGGKKRHFDDREEAVLAASEVAA